MDRVKPQSFLVRAYTNDDGEEWDMGAKYFNYLHDSLGRVERDMIKNKEWIFTRIL
ncbi:MAG: hypothetical protein GQ574_15500 [Crocinitomix sp.]|nr:hypothetical protein [Crocinitomix sp.]